MAMQFKTFDYFFHFFKIHNNANSIMGLWKALVCGIHIGHPHLSHGIQCFLEIFIRHCLKPHVCENVLRQVACHTYYK
jgi:hypothetical protein